MSTWRNPGRRIILASGSPRRSALLREMGIRFDTIVGEPLDENTYIDVSDLDGSLQRLASAKAGGVAEGNPDALVLAADTVVLLEGCVLGKPADRAEARAMLERLSGRCHTVRTAVALTCVNAAFHRSVSASTAVFFRKLSEDEIEWYLDTGEAFDKAGAYGIQGKAMIFIDKIVGCYYNVVGLPVNGTIELFKEFAVRKEARNVANQ